MLSIQSRSDYNHVNAVNSILKEIETNGPIATGKLQEFIKGSNKGIREMLFVEDTHAGYFPFKQVPGIDPDTGKEIYLWDKKTG